jgi:hypothetical protein
MGAQFHFFVPVELKGKNFKIHLLGAGGGRATFSPRWDIILRQRNKRKETEGGCKCRDIFSV